MAGETTEKLGRALDELLTELSDTTAEATADKPEHPLRKIHQGLPEGLVAVYKDAGKDVFYVHTGITRSPLNIPDSPINAIRVHYGVDQIAYSTRHRNTEPAHMKLLSHLRQGLNFAEKGQNPQSYIVVISPDGKELVAIHDAYDPVYGEVLGRGFIAYLSAGSLYAASELGRPKRIGLIEKLISNDLLEPNTAYFHLIDSRGANILGFYYTDLILVNQMPRRVTWFKDFLTRHNVYHSITYRDPPRVQLNRDDGRVLCYIDREGKFTRFDSTSNHTTEAITLADRLKNPKGQLEVPDFRLSHDYRYLGYALEGRIEIVNIRAGDVWQLQGATAPFDIK